MVNIDQDWESTAKIMVLQQLGVRWRVAGGPNYPHYFLTVLLPTTGTTSRREQAFSRKAMIRTRTRRRPAPIAPLSTAAGMVQPSALIGERPQTVSALAYRRDRWSFDFISTRADSSRGAPLF